MDMTHNMLQEMKYTYEYNNLNLMFLQWWLWNISTFWNIMPCGLLKVYQRFRGIYRFHLQATYKFPSKTSVDFNGLHDVISQTTELNIKSWSETKIPLRNPQPDCEHNIKMDLRENPGAKYSQMASSFEYDGKTSYCIQIQHLLICWSTTSCIIWSVMPI
jgi:hypothetical protein